MTAEVVERLVQEMTESHDGQDEAKRDESLAGTQTKDNQSTSNKLEQRNGDPGEPERPDRQKSVGERQEIFSRMFERPQLEDLPLAGHEKDQTENKPRE